MLLLRRPVLKLYSGRGEITDLGAKFANVHSFAKEIRSEQNQRLSPRKIYVRN